jgi:hypothetical protein
MKRLILAATVVLFSTLTLWAQTGGAEPNLMPETSAAHRHQRNRQRNKQHSQHPHHHSSITGRR